MVNPGPVPHVGGPIVMGAATVMVGKMPASRIGDTCTCVGPPDTIAKGSTSVLIEGKPAARITDSTAHGGVIVSGCPTVLIGDKGGGGGGAAPAPMAGLSRQANTLLSAAREASPFCEQCEKEA
nr:PAAR domain-containing protein [Tateyamaria sp. ANG-S1]